MRPRHYLINENIFMNMPRPKGLPPDEWKTIQHSISSTNNNSRSEEDYSEVSFVIDSESDHEDDCVMTDFDFPEDYTIPFNGDNEKPIEIIKDMALILQAEEASKTSLTASIEDVQGPKIKELRFLLGDWLFNLSFCYPTNTETLFQTFILLDRFLATTLTTVSQLQLIGCCCLWISSKVDFHTTASLEPLARYCHNKFTREDFIQAENRILSSVDYKVQHTSSNYFLRRFLDKIHADDLLISVSAFLCESSLLYVCFSGFRQSVVAIASIISAVKILNMKMDFAPLRVYTHGVPSTDIIQVANLLLKCSRTVVGKERLGVVKKFIKRCQDPEIRRMIRDGPDSIQTLDDILPE